MVKLFNSYSFKNFIILYNMNYFYKTKTKVDELKVEQNAMMNFDEFLEAIGRYADKPLSKLLPKVIYKY